jgi:hypothetical protein
MALFALTADFGKLPSLEKTMIVSKYLMVTILALSLSCKNRCNKNKQCSKPSTNIKQEAKTDTSNLSKKKQNEPKRK